MLKVDHPSVVSANEIVRVNLPDQTTRHVLLVDVDMPLAEDDPGFDQEEYAKLVDAIRNVTSDRFDSVEISQTRR